MNYIHPKLFVLRVKGLPYKPSINNYNSSNYMITKPSFSQRFENRCVSNAQSMLINIIIYICIMLTMNYIYDYII